MTVMQRAAEIERSARAAGDAMAIAQWAQCLALCGGNPHAALKTFNGRYPRSLHAGAIKAAVDAGTTFSSDWDILSTPQTAAQGFIEYLRPLSVFEQLRGSFRRVPLNVRAPRATSGSTAAWVGEGKPIPASAMKFESVTFAFAKIAGFVVTTRELIAVSNPQADSIVRADLAAATAAFTDAAFLDPSLAAVANVSPASITYGATQVASTGSTAANVESDLGDLIDAITTNRTGLRLVMQPDTALRLARLRSTEGLPYFPNVGYQGGEIWGIPVVVGGVPVLEESPQQRLIAAIDATEILYADGGVELDATNQASVELQSAPTDPVDASAVLSSLWQLNLAAIKVIRMLNWAPRRSGAVAYLSVDL